MDNTVNANGGNGIYLYMSCNYANIINNTVNLNDGDGGINIYNSCNYSNIINNTVNSNTCGLGGIFVCMCGYNDISDNTVNSNTCEYAGITVYSSSNNIIIGNTAINNTNHSIRMQYGVANLIYNNYFTNGVDAFKGSNIWNTTPTTGPNIVGGPEIGGNYWGDYTGTDDDGDGFGNEPYSILDRFTGCFDHDHLPLVSSMPMCGDITGDGNIDTADLLRLLEHVVKGTHVPACACDIDGNGHINILDVRLLMGYINDSTEYPLNCGC
jgi:parallel beta-helix repeat protein